MTYLSTVDSFTVESVRFVSQNITKYFEIEEPSTECYFMERVELILIKEDDHYDTHINNK